MASDRILVVPQNQLVSPNSEAPTSLLRNNLQLHQRLLLRQSADLLTTFVSPCKLPCHDPSALR